MLPMGGWCSKDGVGCSLTLYISPGFHLCALHVAFGASDWLQDGPLRQPCTALIHVVWATRNGVDRQPSQPSILVFSSEPAPPSDSFELRVLIVQGDWTSRAPKTC